MTLQEAERFAAEFRSYVSPRNVQVRMVKDTAEYEVYWELGTGWLEEDGREIIHHFLASDADQVSKSLEMLRRTERWTYAFFATPGEGGRSAIECDYDAWIGWRREHWDELVGIDDAADVRGVVVYRLCPVGAKVEHTIVFSGCDFERDQAPRYWSVYAMYARPLILGAYASYEEALERLRDSPWRE
jgi:hypothetical protein